MFPLNYSSFITNNTESYDSVHEFDSENESSNILHLEDHESEFSIYPTDTDNNTQNSSNESNDAEPSSAADDDSSTVEADDEDNNSENVQLDVDNDSEEDSFSPEAKRFKADSALQSDDSECVDPSRKCPICLGAWTSVGDHRLCALQCGHLFGYKCIKSWLQFKKPSSKQCPLCNARASIRHIRFLYANKVTCLDSRKLEKIKNRYQEIKRKYYKVSKALNKQKRRTKKYKQMYKARTLALTADSDFCFSD